jgi:hypothetical protein
MMDTIWILDKAPGSGGRWSGGDVGRRVQRR